VRGDTQLPLSPPCLPTQIPYSAILPKRAEATNLLVPVCLSASHVAWGSIRVEPTFTQIGSAAGIAAAQAAAAGIAVQDVPIAGLQREIVAHGQCVHWPLEQCNNTALC